MGHLAYFPHIATCDYHIFRSLQSFLSSKHFNSTKALKKYKEYHFSPYNKKYFEEEFKKLPTCWEEIINKKIYFKNYLKLVFSFTLKPPMKCLQINGLA